jgi:hypothetical protein
MWVALQRAKGDSILDFELRITKCIGQSGKSKARHLEEFLIANFGFIHRRGAEFAESRGIANFGIRIYLTGSIAPSLEFTTPALGLAPLLVESLQTQNTSQGRDNPHPRYR